MSTQSDHTPALVVTQTNDAGSNALVAFTRDDGGRLTEAGTFPTKGTGSGAAHLPSQGSVAFSGDGRHIFVTNAGSGDVSVFSVGTGGPALAQVLPAGPAPRSVAEHAGLVYVLATGDPSVTGFRWTGDAYTPIERSTRTLDTDADAAQVGFTADGRALLVTERGRDAVVTFPVLPSGLLGQPTETPSSGPTPYGFAVTPGGVLVVTEAFGARKGEAAASSYRMGSSGPAAVTASLGNGRSEICWAVTTPDGRHALTTNFADGAVSSWAIAVDGTLTLLDATAGITVDGRAGLRDEALCADGRFLYAVDADAGELAAWSVEGGTLTCIGSWGDLPATVAGLAAR